MDQFVDRHADDLQSSVGSHPLLAEGDECPALPDLGPKLGLDANRPRRHQASPKLPIDCPIEPEVVARMAPPLPDHDVVGAESCGELGRVRPLAQAGSGTRTPSYMRSLEGHPFLATSLTTDPSLRIGKDAIEGDAPVRAVLLGPWAQRLLGRGVSHGLKLPPARDRQNVSASVEAQSTRSSPLVVPESLPLSQLPLAGRTTR
jgi:hypothetical protein